MINFSSAAVRWLEDAVARLKVDGVSSFPWNENSLSLLQPVESDLDRLKASLSQADLACRTLGAMLQYADEARSRLRELHSNLFLQTKFVKLPDEIFSLIFEFAGYEDILASLHVSWTCRRFREIALGNPRLWTFVYGLKKEGMEAIGARSKGLAMCLGNRPIHPSKGFQSWWKFTDVSDLKLNFSNLLNYAIQNAARLVHLHADLDHLRLFTSEETLPDCSSVSFSSLRSLSMRDTSLDDREFFKDWDLPSLGHLELRNEWYGTLPAFKPAILEGLTSLKIDQICDDPEMFFPYLSCCKFLKEIQITVREGAHSEKEFSDFIKANNTRSDHLSNVESFSIFFLGGHTSSFISILLSWFRMPNLRSFTVEASSGYYEHCLIISQSADTGFVDSIRDTVVHARKSLETLSISLESGEAYHGLGVLCDGLSSLRNLYITAPPYIDGKDEDSYRTGLSVPPNHRQRSLARFKFDNCSKMGYEKILHRLGLWRKHPDIAADSCITFDGKDEQKNVHELFNDGEIYESYEPVYF